MRSNALVIFKDPGHDERPSALGVFLNIGFQQQKRRNYAGGFLGIRCWAKDNTQDEVFDILKAGLVIGRVF